MEYYWVFIKNGMYLVLSDEELGDGKTLIRFPLEEDGFELVWDSAFTKDEAERYAKEFYCARKFEAIPVPITLKDACAFINKHHRHHVAPQGHKFSLAIGDGQDVIGVAIAGRPVSRYQDDGMTLEITRCCVKTQYRNRHVCSQLYAAVRRIAKEMGYHRVITYTLESESGGSLKACGFHLKGISDGGSWNSRSRKRVDKHPVGEKKVWEMQISL